MYAIPELKWCTLYSYRSVLPDLFHHLYSHTLPSLHHLDVLCDDHSDVLAVTEFLPQCTNLRTLQYECGCHADDAPGCAVEYMWEAAVRRCKNLEVVIVSEENGATSCNRLRFVLRKLSAREGLQALKLRSIIKVDRGTGREEDYTEQAKHLLPALQ